MKFLKNKFEDLFSIFCLGKKDNSSLVEKSLQPQAKEQNEVNNSETERREI